jgi:hypothetical protein
MNVLVEFLVEIPVVLVDALYEYQCLDPISRRRSEARLFDPNWEYERHGLLGH